MHQFRQLRFSQRHDSSIRLCGSHHPLAAIHPARRMPVRTFPTSANNRDLRDDKGGGRLDANTRLGMISGYYMMDDYTLVSPYATSSLPGFADQNAGRAQLIELSDTKSFGASSLNEFRASFMRNAIFENEPIPGQGLGPSFSSLGFVEGFNTLGHRRHCPAVRRRAPHRSQRVRFWRQRQHHQQFDNMFQFQDNFSKVIGTHTIKFGGELPLQSGGPDLAGLDQRRQLWL